MRDMKKYIAEYRRKYEGSNEGGFYASDLQQIRNISGGGDAYELIDNALMAGFMIGYRKAQRDARKKASSRK